MRRKISILLLALCVATSCSKQTDGTPEVVGNTIQMATDVATRGVVTTTENMVEFVCFGYSQGKSLWLNASTTATSDLMWSNLYTKQLGVWAGTTATQWPSGTLDHYYAFFAYSPAASTENKVTLLTAQATAGYQKLSYETLADVETQVDLVVASRLNQQKANEVTLPFTHALTRVGFRAFTNMVNTKLNSIFINGMKYKGDLEVRRDATWSNQSADLTNFKVEMNPALAISTDQTKPTDLSGGGRYFFVMLPQDLTGNSTATTCITINYTQLGVDISKSYTIKEDLAMGRSTIYEVDLSGIPNTDLIVSDIIVSDWVVGGQEDLDSNNGETE